MPLGFVAGWALLTNIMRLGSISLPFEPDSWPAYAFYIVSGLFFSLVMFFSAPSFMRGLFALSNRIEKSLSRYNAKEIFMGVVGLLLGLGLTFLISLPLQSINTTVYFTLIIFFGIIFGFLGMRLGSKIMSQVLPATNVDKKSPPIHGNPSSIKVLDSSSLIDGRVLDVVRTGFITGQIIIPNFILSELSRIADDEDVLKKNRGRRGLDIAAALQQERGITVKISDDIEESDTDSKLLKTAEFYKAKIITNDYNLGKLAAARSIDTLNINDLANAIKPIALPGEKMTLQIVKHGKERGQGVAYTPDGTMIVVENGGDSIGETKEVVVTTSLQTSAGRIIFTRIM